MLLRRVIRVFGLAHLVFGALAATVLLSEPTSRRYGDNLQVALPVLAWGCSASKGGGREFALRFVSMFAIAHGSKLLLGDMELNQRPSGGDRGFPSAHTGAAAIGASSLMHDCLRGNAGAQAVVVIAAAFVGSSRIEVGAHDIWQVLAGAVLGWAADRALRRDSRVRRRVVACLNWVTSTVQQGFCVSGVWFGQLFLTLRRRVWPATVLVSALLSAQPARAETELSLYGGVQAVAPSDITDASGSQHVTWQGRSLTAPPYYGLRLTRWSETGWGYGLEVNHAKAYADVPADYGYERLEFSDGLNLVTLNLWRRWQAGPSGLAPYAGVGVGVAVPHVDVTPVGGQHTFGYQVTGPALQAVLGLRRDFSPRWSIFGEAKATWSRHDARIDGMGRLQTDLTTGAVNFGVSRRF